MLMALFYEACPFKQKRRVHFNMFMLEVHAFIHEYRQQNNTDAISALAKKIRASVLLLCFDEFHVTDIADAMILGRLFSKLFESGVIVVITSNRHPDDLYLGGLQREQFLNFYQTVATGVSSYQLVAKEDYRLSACMHWKPLIISPLGCPWDAFVQHSYNEFLSCDMQPGVLHVQGRQRSLSATAWDVG